MINRVQKQRSSSNVIGTQSNSAHKQESFFLEDSMEYNSDSYDELQYQIEEAELLSQRNPHYCSE